MKRGAANPMLSGESVSVLSEVVDILEHSLDSSGEKGIKFSLKEA